MTTQNEMAAAYKLARPSLRWAIVRELCKLNRGYFTWIARVFKNADDFADARATMIFAVIDALDRWNENIQCSFPSFLIWHLMHYQNLLTRGAQLVRLPAIFYHHLMRNDVAAVEAFLRRNVLQAPKNKYQDCSVSLDAPADENNDGDRAGHFAHVYQEHDDHIFLNSTRRALRYSKAIKRRDAELFALYSGLSDGYIRTLSEAGKPFGVTRERTRQLVNNTTLKLKRYFREDFR